jgi:hypothetical protein
VPGRAHVRRLGNFCVGGCAVSVECFWEGEDCGEERRAGGVGNYRDVWIFSLDAEERSLWREL